LIVKLQLPKLQLSIDGDSAQLSLSQGQLWLGVTATLAGVLVLADAVAVVDEEGGVDVEVLPSLVATALAPFAGFLMYLVKQMGNL
jgi:drug/metabolite transporter (DMT)-like permease